MVKTEVAEAACPSCSPDEPTTHVILRHDGLVKCEECGFVHAVRIPKKKVLKVRVIVSRQGASSGEEIELDEDDVVHVGDELVVEHKDDEVSGVQVQSIEVKTKGRPEKAVARDIDTLWARTIDEVIVKIAVQKGAVTESVNYKVSGDHEFKVGDTVRMQGYEAVITSIKEREAGHHRRLGKAVKAKDIKRIFSRSLTSTVRYGRRTGGIRKRPTGTVGKKGRGGS
ncbi:MAG TPA: HVO_0476 family zinc finger protein [Methanocella sp.]|nr:HVO_0476 family zinc finger protein [Methanocella sp.]